MTSGTSTAPQLLRSWSWNQNTIPTAQPVPESPTPCAYPIATLISVDPVATLVSGVSSWIRNYSLQYEEHLQRLQNNDESATTDPSEDEDWDWEGEDNNFWSVDADAVRVSCEATLLEEQRRRHKCAHPLRNALSRIKSRRRNKTEAKQHQEHSQIVVKKHHHEDYAKTPFGKCREKLRKKLKKKEHSSRSLIEEESLKAFFSENSAHSERCNIEKKPPLPYLDAVSEKRRLFANYKARSKSSSSLQTSRRYGNGNFEDGVTYDNLHHNIPISKFPLFLSSKKEGKASRKTSIRSSLVRTGMHTKEVTDTLLTKSKSHNCLTSLLEGDTLKTYQLHDRFATKLENSFLVVCGKEVFEESSSSINHSLKVILVGNDEFSKTSIVQRFQPKSTSTNSDVNVSSWKNAENDLEINFWNLTNTSISENSLFFSPNSIYILVWDLGIHSGNSLLSQTNNDENDYAFREKKRKGLDQELEDNFFSWMDAIQNQTRDSGGAVILPVIQTGNLNEDEVGYRVKCLLDRTRQVEDSTYANLEIIWGANRSPWRIACRNDFDALHAKIASFSSTSNTSPKKCRLGEKILPVTKIIQEQVRELKKIHKLIPKQHLFSLLDENVLRGEVEESLFFLSDIGEVNYFGERKDHDLKHPESSSVSKILGEFIILNPKWLMATLSCITRSDAPRGISSSMKRHRRNHSDSCLSIHSSSTSYTTSSISSRSTSWSTDQPLCSGYGNIWDEEYDDSHRSILRIEDALFLWQSKSFIQEMIDNFTEGFSSSAMYEFLKNLFIHFDLLVSLDGQNNKSEHFFVPSLLEPLHDHSEVWSDKTRTSWRVTLGHSWSFQESISPGLMRRLEATVLKNIYAATSDVNQNYADASGLRICSALCWENAFLLQFAHLVFDDERGKDVTTTTEVFGRLTSTACGTNQLILSAKGRDDDYASRIWNGGFRLVLNTVEEFLSIQPNVKREVICPVCLQRKNLKKASSWSYERVNEGKGIKIRCGEAHSVDKRLLCGKSYDKWNLDSTEMSESSSDSPQFSPKPVQEILGGVVLVGLWHGKEKKITNLGSGFIIDKKRGLIVTAAHTFIKLGDNSDDYFGIKNSKVIVGIIPPNSNAAVFRYFAHICTKDGCNADVCVLQIDTRLEEDVEDSEKIKNMPETPLRNDKKAMKREDLQQLAVTHDFELDEHVRILGYNQSGEGLFTPGRYIDRYIEVTRGNIDKFWKPDYNQDSHQNREFRPREEIVLNCPTIIGHSGGPCVNQNNEVIGILSSAHGRDRSYIVPAKEWKSIVKKAKNGDLNHISDLLY